MGVMRPIRGIQRVKAHGECADCPLLERLVPASLGLEERRRLKRLIRHNCPLKRNAFLFRSGSTFKWLYSIRSGFLKSRITKPDNSKRIVAFHMARDLVGMDGTPGTHFCDAIALQDSAVCQIACSDIEQISAEIPKLRQHLDRLIMHAMVRDYGSMLVLDNMHSRERLAFFLLNLSSRYAARGGSRNPIKLEMPRKDIENYLGMTPETLSGTLADLEQERIIELKNRSVQIMNRARLQKISKDYVTRRRAR